MSDLASIESTLAHLEAVVRKRDRLNAALADGLDALAHQLAREGRDRVVATRAYGVARASAFPNAGRPIADAAGYKLGHLRSWLRDGVPDDRLTFAGSFPVPEDPAEIPYDGVPAVYVLFAGERAVYIGRSRRVRSRLRTHWRTPAKREAGIDRWWLMVCEVDQLADLELRLIREHQPLLNLQGKGAAA